MIVSNKYKDPEYFCNLPGNIKSRSLSIFHHSVRSLSKNFDQLHALLTKFDIDFDFIGITESRISKTNFSQRNIALANYVIEQTPTESNAGGALLYIISLDLLKFNSCSSICNSLDELSSSYFTPQIFLPSHIIGSTKMLIDNIFCNKPQSSERNISANLTSTYLDLLPQVLLVTSTSCSWILPV